MGLKRQNHNKFLKIAAFPIKVLGKARDLYVKSMTSCASGVSYGSSMSMAGQLPKSYSMGSSMSNDAEDYRELIRAASVRSLGHRNEIDMLLHQSAAAKAKALPKSCSVGMGGFMGRIDEDKAEEDGSVGAGVKKVGKSASSELYPRSKSYAVGKTTAAF